MKLQLVIETVGRSLMLERSCRRSSWRLWCWGTWQTFRTLLSLPCWKVYLRWSFRTLLRPSKITGLDFSDSTKSKNWSHASRGKTSCRCKRQKHEHNIFLAVEESSVFKNESYTNASLGEEAGYIIEEHLVAVHYNQWCHWLKTGSLSGQIAYPPR